MKENVGRNDQIARSIIGPALMLWGYHGWGGKDGRMLGLAAIVAGGLISETALTRTCPLNDLLGMDTTERGTSYKQLNHLKQMPSRDTSGNCEGECRDRVKEGENERQRVIAREDYSSPSPNSPNWTKKRNEPPGSMGGRV